MKSILVILALTANVAAAAAGPFKAGQKISCFDDVSSETSTIKITSTSPLSAYVRIEGKDGARFYKAADVGAWYDAYELSLDMKTPSGTKESFVLSANVAYGTGAGIYADGGDSRAIDCKVVAGGVAHPGQGSNAACKLQNHLSRDSFDVARWGFEDCFAHSNAHEVVCTIKAKSVVVKDLDEGVGTLKATYRDNANGTHDLSINDKDGMVTAAQGLPESVSMKDAILTIYNWPEDESKPAGYESCEWTLD